MKLTFLNDPTAPTAAYVYTCENHGNCKNCKKCPKGNSYCNNTLVLLDCPATVYQLVQKLSFTNCPNVCIILKNLDLEYLSGITNVVNFLYEKYRISSNIVMEERYHYNMQNILSCSRAQFKSHRLILMSQFYQHYYSDVDWFSHPSGGYELRIGDTTVFYTGHTTYFSGIFGYINLCKTPPENIEFYVDVSGSAKEEDTLREHLTKLKNSASKGIKIYLMNAPVDANRLIAGCDNIQIASSQ